MQITSNNSQFFEGCGQIGPIRCIFLSEFHPSLGPKITCQVPDGYVSKDIFDSVNVYIIPKPQLQRCILTVNTLGYKIVGYPVRIDGQRYARNAYYFNLCFVCDAWARTIQYEPVIKKLAEYLIMMEDETEFLSRDDEKEELKLDRITKLLTNILTDLNERKVTTIIEGETTIYLKILNPKPDPQPVLDHLVPLLCEAYENAPIDVWDLTTQQVLPYINGINHVARIAAESDVEKALVKACIQNLVYHEVVQLLPLLKYSNVYMCTRNLQNLTKDRVLGQSCRKFVAVTSESLPSLYKILQIYSFMTHAVNLRTLCQRTCPRDNNIDERKLVTFGLQNNLIRCVNKYPICTDTPIGRQNMYTGLDNMDEICCMTGMLPSKIDEDIEADPFLTVIWK
ncbi:GATOR complex protein NPRL2 [Bradysia coprophila]|uniref:GATOR complex protein NPRL2 n=1 Tax=Bradysia coprophila TaxID=38358 RepID=UPI00187D7A67|nr:GATOR complex protein NPRL2 [Bradysia coprophila]